jgi:macrolide transport system ATP-binding/permease protein
MTNWFRRVWYLVNRRRHERELMQEMQEHRDLMHDAARFGNTYRLLEQSRDAWGWNWLDDAMQDLKIGVRTLVKSPSFAITATLILTFGIGLNVTLYQMIQVGLLRPPAVKDADSWVRLIRNAPDSSTSTVPYPLAQFVKEHNSVLAGVMVEHGASIAWGRDADQQINGLFVSPNWFSEIGYGALHGRVLSDALDGSDDAPAVVLSYTFWNTRLGADPTVVGTTAYIDRKPVTIIGIAPAALPGLDYNVPDVFVPITQREYFYPQSALLQAWGGDGNGVDMYGRLRPGVSQAAAREALRSTMQAMAAERPEVKSSEWLEPLLARHNFMRPSERYAVLAVVSLIGSLTGLVLIVAAANLGNLVMSRATGRVRELGVRMALGARRSRIVRQLVIEAVPLVAMGVAGSLLFASATATLIAAFAELPPYFDFSIEWRTVAIAVALGGLSLLVVGVLPAWKVAQQHLIDAIKDGGQHVTRMLDRALMRRVMVAAQVAGSCLLLVVAGMMVRSVQRAMQSSMGFDYQRAAVLSIPLDRHGVAGDAARSYWYAVKDRVRAHPEVEDAAIVTAPPLGGLVNETSYNATPGTRTLVQSVDPEYFAVMRIPLISGRLFGPAEAKTAIVSRRLALEMYGTLDVLGREFPKGASEATIIGVAGDAHSIKVEANDVAELYLPLKLEDFSFVYLVARARTDADRLPPVLREAASLDPRVIPTAKAMHEDFDQRMLGPRLASMIAAGIGVLTLALACLGIFGVVSYGVALRTKEIGIRVALGARQPALLRSIVRQVLTPVVIGAGIGMILAIPAGIALRGEPFYLENGDPMAFALALAVFVCAGALAALWPAYLMLRRNPVDALRHS